LYKERLSFWGGRLSFASSNDVPLATTLLIKHLFIAKEDARSVALHD
jgi:hypothetical protein